MNDAEKKKRPISGAVFTILIIFSCVAVYLFTESGYGKEAEMKEIEDSAAAGDTIDEGVSIAYFEDKALSGMAYIKDPDGAYIITRDGLPDARLILTERNYALAAFLLSLEAPAAPEPEKEEESSIIEDRLRASQKEYYNKQMEWLSENLPRMIRAMDRQALLTDADIDDIMYYINATVATGKRQNTSINEIELRSYIDDMDEAPRLRISMQINEKNNKKEQ